MIKGFLDYRDLLAVYFHNTPNPNLFELIVLTLLGEHIPVRSGGTFKFKDKWDQLQRDLINLSYTRSSRVHRSAIAELPIYRTHLTSTLNQVFTELNRLLTVYFPELNIELGYDLKPFTFNYGFKWQWHTSSELYLNVKKDGVLIVGDYSDILNEARLSAFAICLYLASLKSNPTNVDLKILYLDDIFIGLDGSNRIPILNILKAEFVDYQIFISSYDRYTFEVAKRHFEISNPQGWSSMEFYVAKDKIGNTDFDKPLVVQDENNFGKAVYFLHHPIKPDYPASANYFRKFAEELLMAYLPSNEIRNEDYTLIENYKLGYLVSSGLHFFSKINANNILLLELRNLLPTILHPLSHFDLSSPVYRKELIDAQKCLFELEQYLKALQSSYRPFIPQSMMLKLRLVVSQNFTGYYEIHAKEMIYLINNPGTTPTLSNGSCHARCSYTIDQGNKSPETRYSLNNGNFNYASFEDAYNNIFSFLNLQAQFAGLQHSQDYTSEFEMNNNGNWQTLNTLLIW